MMRCGQRQERIDLPEWPRITIVTPTFNRARYLDEAIESVLAQNYANLEYIIVDGGSTDGATLELIKRYGERLAWWTSEPDAGHAEAIRKGFARSTGDVMTWFCSDDVYVPGTLRAVGEAFLRRPKIDVLYGNSRVIDPSGRKIRDVHAVPYARLALMHHIGFLQPSTFWRRSLYERVGGQLGGSDLKYNVYEPHIELFCRFAKAGAKFVFINRILTCVREHEGRVPVTPELGQLVEAAWREAFPFWTRRGIFEALKVAMRLRQLFYYLIQGDFDELKYYFRTRPFLRPARF